MVDTVLLNRLLLNLDGYYEKIEPEQVLAVVKTRLDDFAVFADAVRKWTAHA